MMRPDAGNVGPAAKPSEPNAIYVAFEVVSGLRVSVFFHPACFLSIELAGTVVNAPGVGVKMIHPVFHVVPFRQVAWSDDAHMVTAVPRLIASDLARFRSLKKELVSALTRKP